MGSGSRLYCFSKNWVLKKTKAAAVFDEKIFFLESVGAANI